MIAERQPGHGIGMNGSVRFGQIRPGFNGVYGDGNSSWPEPRSGSALYTHRRYHQYHTSRLEQQGICCAPTAKQARVHSLHPSEWDQPAMARGLEHSRGMAPRSGYLHLGCGYRDALWCTDLKSMQPEYDSVRHAMPDTTSFFVLPVGLSRTSRRLVRLLGLGTASRPRLVARHRSGVRVPHALCAGTMLCALIQNDPNGVVLY